MKLEDALDRIWQVEKIRRDKLRDVIGIVMALALDPLRGGLPAFLEAFRQKGMANHIKAWESGNLDSTVEADQMAWVFGGRLMDAIAKRVDLDSAAVARCLCEAVPGVVGSLTDYGNPNIDNLPEELRFYLRNFEGFAQGIPGLESTLRGELGIPGHQPTNTMQRLLQKLKSILSD